MNETDRFLASPAHIRPTHPSLRRMSTSACGVAAPPQGHWVFHARVGADGKPCNRTVSTWPDARRRRCTPPGASHRTCKKPLASDGTGACQRARPGERGADDGSGTGSFPFDRKMTRNGRVRTQEVGETNTGVTVNVPAPFHAQDEGHESAALDGVRWPWLCAAESLVARLHGRSTKVPSCHETRRTPSFETVGERPLSSDADLCIPRSRPLRPESRTCDLAPSDSTLVRCLSRRSCGSKEASCAAASCSAPFHRRPRISSASLVRRSNLAPSPSWSLVPSTCSCLVPRAAAVPGSEDHGPSLPPTVRTPGTEPRPRGLRFCQAGRDRTVGFPSCCTEKIDGSHGAGKTRRTRPRRTPKGGVGSSERSAESDRRTGGDRARFG